MAKRRVIFFLSLKETRKKITKSKWRQIIELKLLAATVQKKKHYYKYKKIPFIIFSYFPSIHLWITCHFSSNVSPYWYSYLTFHSNMCYYKWISNIKSMGNGYPIWSQLQAKYIHILHIHICIYIHIYIICVQIFLIFYLMYLKSLSL